jgi:hypothetical protein
VGTAAGETEGLPLKDLGNEKERSANAGAHEGTGLEYNNFIGCTIHHLNTKEPDM